MSRGIVTGLGFWSRKLRVMAGTKSRKARFKWRPALKASAKTDPNLMRFQAH